MRRQESVNDMTARVLVELRHLPCCTLAPQPILHGQYGALAFVYRGLRAHHRLLLHRRSHLGSPHGVRGLESMRSHMLGLGVPSPLHPLSPHMAPNFTYPRPSGTHTAGYASSWGLCAPTHRRRSQVPHDKHRACPGIYILLPRNLLAVLH